MKTLILKALSSVPHLQITGGRDYEDKQSLVRLNEFVKQEPFSLDRLSERTGVDLVFFMHYPHLQQF